MAGRGDRRQGFEGQAASATDQLAATPTMGRRLLLRYGAALLTGLLYAACFSPYDWWPLGWVALLPLLLALPGSGPWHGAALGLLAGMTGTLAAVHWLGLPLIHVYSFSLGMAALFLLGIALYIGVFYALAGLLIGWLHRRELPLAILWVPALWVAAELLRSRLGIGVPWLLAGHTQVLALPVVQLADITGVFGVSFLLLLVNQALAELFSQHRLRGLAVASVAVTLALGYGGVRLWWLEQPQAEPPGALQVAIVQPSIPQAEKWDRRHFASGLRQLYRLTREAVEQGPATPTSPHLVIWPETALTVDVEQAGPTLEPVLRLLATPERAAWLLLGAPRLFPPEAAVVRNSAALFDPTGRRQGVYDKELLLPFGEYYPAWVRAIPSLHRLLADRMGQPFEAGPPGQLLELAGLPFTVAICYEATYPELVGARVARGAQLIVNLTNDAWFEGSAGAAQHLAMTRLRAVEHRVPLVRAANTGISALIEASGRVQATFGLDRTGLLRGVVVPGPGHSLYTRWGDAFAGCCVAGLPLWFCADGLRRRPFLRRSGRSAT